MPSSILEEMARQAQFGMEPIWFSCQDCKNYEGRLVCKKRVFIAFENANMFGCRFFELGQRCPHCGRNF